MLLDKAIAYFATHGVGDTSLRTLAGGIGSSHRMLLYHFGSRTGLLATMVDHSLRVQEQLLGQMLAGADDPYEAAWRFWTALADDREFAPLFFELAAAAMQGHEWASPLRGWMRSWTELMTQFFVDVGQPPEKADLLARTAIALTRGLFFDLALTGDRDGADRTVAAFLDSTRPSGPDS